jgi:hypothetical protein
VPKRRLAATAALFISAASLTAITASSASATSAATLYVDKSSPSCTDSGTGSPSAPFCTIQAAANVVGPGQTVLISGEKLLNGDYSESVLVKHSGTAAAPITFAAADRYFLVNGPQGPAFNLTGVSDIVIKGVFANSIGVSVAVSNSSNITIEDSTLWQGWVPAPSPLPVATVHVTNHSSAVTVQRSWIAGHAADAVLVDGGSTGTVVATNVVNARQISTGIAVSGATGTAVAGNTIDNGQGCVTGISVTANSASTSVENNVIAGLETYYNPDCEAGTATDLSVSADSAGTTNAQYNVLADDGLQTTPYAWAGKTYATAADFEASTGKGAQDIVPNGGQNRINSFPISSPMIDSADANAPGETSIDIYGNPRVDDASVPNTGTAVGYYDRGALEYQEYTSSSLVVDKETPQYVETFFRVQGVPWGYPVVKFNWGDGTSNQGMVNQAGTDTDFTRAVQGQHLYALPGTYTITATLTDDAGTKTLTQTVTTTGDTYVPVTPTRVLDTRHGIGTGGATSPIPGGASVAFNPTSGVSGAPAGNLITAVVLNVTVAGPTGGGYISAYPDGTARPQSSNLNFTPGESVPNLVTVKIGADGKVALFNGSGGTSHLVADVEGYYIASAAGNGYVPVSPARLLDTRKGIGTGGSTSPVPVGGTLNLKIDGSGPVAASGVTAVALNVTVTKPTGGGYITVYPSGAALPKASNVNFSANETVANMVIVPVGKDGTINLTNGSNGTTALVADVFGYYVSTGTGGHAFIPVNPTRIIAAAPIPPGVDLHTQPQGEAYLHTALVLNVTVTQPTAGGYITAYTAGTPLPTVSNLNFSAGETVPNLVITPDAELGQETLLHNGSGGTVNMIVDLFGYFS